jgi:N-sulfoglucosamine sulfohydrolase
MRSLSIALTLFGLALAPALASAAEPKHHNVVLIVADDLGMEVGCFGNKVIQTPNIDALAKNGTRFTHSFATVSSCSPSRACLYSGLYTHTSGQYGLAHATHHFRSQENIKSLPRVLKDAGYHCAILGKNHVAPVEAYPFEKEIAVNGRSVKVVAQKAGEYMKENDDKQFCLIVGFADPHRAAGGFANGPDYPGVKEIKYDPKDMIVPPFLPNHANTRKDLADYYQSVSRLDQGVGFVLEQIKLTGHADDTLLIFLSDNGIPFPGAKTTLYDPGLNLPLVIASPGQKKRGVVNNAMTSYVDVMPTILEYMGVKPPPGLPGRSLMPILDEEKPAGWDVVYGSHQMHEVTMYFPMRMIRTRTHKLILNLAHPLEFPCAADLYDSLTWQGILKRGDKMLGERTLENYLHRPREELYDLEKDPNEMKNVADDPKYADVLKDLRARLKDWQVKTKDPWIVKYTHE